MTSSAMIRHRLDSVELRHRIGHSRRRASAMAMRLLPLLIAAASACEAPAADAGASSADGPLWKPGEEWRLSEEPILTIGALDGPEVIGSVSRITEESGVALL